MFCGYGDDGHLGEQEWERSVGARRILFKYVSIPKKDENGFELHSSHSKVNRLN